MENSIYTGLSRQMALQEKMDVISNNVANMSTPGYKAQNMVFQEYIDKPSRSLGRTDTNDSLSMVLDFGQYQDKESGPLQQTGNPLDVALEGTGWMGVQTAAGLRYTRAGNFTINQTGEIVTSSGLRVASSGGGPITIPENSGPVSIDEMGNISTKDGQIGQLMVVDFENTQDLRQEGNGLYASDFAGTPATETRVKQGMLEGSNVKPIIEMTRMVDVLRNYQATQKMLQAEHDRQRTMIQKLGSAG